MNVLLTIVLAVQILTALAMIGLILLQHGKGADMGAAFGGGASGSLFGATGSANFLSRSTAACATVFFVCTLALAYLSSRERMTEPTTGGNAVNAARTSEGMFFEPAEFPVCARLEARLARLLDWPAENGEGLQILRYRRRGLAHLARVHPGATEQMKAGHPFVHPGIGTEGV